MPNNRQFGRVEHNKVACVHILLDSIFISSIAFTLWCVPRNKRNYPNVHESKKVYQLFFKLNVLLYHIIRPNIGKNHSIACNDTNVRKQMNIALPYIQNVQGIKTIHVCLISLNLSFKKQIIDYRSRITETPMYLKINSYS